MKLKKIMTIAFLFSIFAVPSVYAQSLKIGYVDMQKALNDVEEGKQAKAQLKAQFESKQQALQAKQASLQKLMKDLEAKRGTLSKEALEQKMVEYRQKFLELQQTLGTYREEMMKLEAQKTGAILNKVKAVVSKVGASEGYSFIYEKSQDSILYAPNATDLTAKVISKYNSGN